MQACLTGFEIDPDLQRMIGLSHPGLKLYGDAQELPAILEDLGIDKLDCIISNLPFTVLPPAMTARILDAVQDTLVPGGKFVAYQYSKIMKRHFESRFSEIRTSFVPINIPSAFVYECRPNSLPSLPTTLIMSGVAITTSKSNQPSPCIF